VFTITVGGEGGAGLALVSPQAAQARIVSRAQSCRELLMGSLL
jgi:hypothetical protein